MDGLLLVDKPEGPTSHDVVEHARHLLDEERIGHAGTLDPPAGGLLVLAVGRALKILQFMEDHDKEYDFTVRFGVVTDTDDATGRVLREADPSGLDRAKVEAVLDRFRGKITQVPPRYSAIKKDGKRLHRAARRGEEVRADPRTVHVHSLDLVEWSPPCARFHAACSKGTYVRAIARDLGEALGVGASVESLRRTASGPFRVEDAIDLDRPRREIEQAFLPADAGLGSLLRVKLSKKEAQHFAHGQKIEKPCRKGLARVYDGENFVGVGESDGATLKPRKVLA
ncbi:MAG: tRNA pseudouridine(55) synthase TruB [Planctomycetota bacterium]|jgi:tRNA pseudouridine55 synthase